MARPGKRALVIDPDPVAGGRASDTLRAAGYETKLASDAESGMRLLASFEPEVIVVELEQNSERGCVWLLRRLRDEYMGARPRIALTTRHEAITAVLHELDVDAVVLKPFPAGAIVAACAPDGDAAIVPGGKELMLELVRLSMLFGDVDVGMTALARRLALGFGMAECVLHATVGERRWVRSSRGAVPESMVTESWEKATLAATAGATLLELGPGGGVRSHIAFALAGTERQRIGLVHLWDDRARVVRAPLLDALRALGGRLHVELTWRTVHERIAADRDRLRETSMLDAMLGVWTRGALDQALPAEVADCQRRGEPLCVAVLNVKGLKNVNDLHGHLVGDEALRQMANLTRAALRTPDIVARYAGDSLALVLSATPLEHARVVIERILAAIESTPVIHGDKRVNISARAGLAMLQGEDDTGEAAVARAAGAVSTARRRRENLYVAEVLVPGQSPGPDANAEGLAPGTTLGGIYQVLHEISRGAMGVVYRAEDLGLGRPVALKTLRPDLARDQNFVERFRTEASTLAAIRHDNLVQVYAFGQDRDDVYFVMELVEGEPLGDRIETARREHEYLPLDFVGHILIGIGAALDAMHRAGVLHRDVKPANILFDRVRGQAVLVDVGIAKRRGTPTDPAGTPGYTAPETFIGGLEGPASDVYALAATAYTLLTAHEPFGEGTMDELLARQRDEPPPPASRWRPGIPAAADAVLKRALLPDAGRRYQSAVEFSGALLAALSSAGDTLDAEVAGPTVSVRDVPTERLPGPARAGWHDDDDDDTRAPARPMPGASTRFPTLATTASLRTVNPPAAQVPDDAPSPLGPPVAAMREPELPAGNEPHTRGVLFRSAYRVLGARQGAAWVAVVSRKDAALAQALRPQTTLLSWHPTSAFVAMLHQIADSGRDASAFARELGRVSAAVTFSRFFGADPAALSPAHVLAAADLLWRRYHTWGTVTVAPARDRAIEVALVGSPRDALVCAATSGILEQVALLSGASASRVTHVACEAEGASACLFGVTWTMAQAGSLNSPPASGRV